MYLGNPGCLLVAQTDTLQPASQSESSIYGMYGYAAPATLGWTCHQNVTKPFASTPFLSELQEGRRSRGGQMKRFSDNVKRLLKKCQMPPSQLEALTADRLVWRDVCKDGLATFSYQLRSGGRSLPASSPHHLLAADSRPTLPHL